MELPPGFPGGDEAGVGWKRGMRAGKEQKSLDFPVSHLGMFAGPCAR